MARQRSKHLKGYLENEKPGHDLEIEEGGPPPEGDPEGDPERDIMDERYGGYVRGWGGILPIWIRSNRSRESRE